MPLEKEGKINLTLVINERDIKRPGHRIYAKGYGFLSFTKTMGKNLRSKFGQRLLDTTTNALETASMRVIQKTAEATCDLAVNKIA